MEQTAFWISVGALILSALSYYFAKRSWRESHRPLVTARVVSCGTGLGDSMSATALNLIVENSGNRPAKNIRLRVDHNALQAAFADRIDPEDREQVCGCFEAKFAIPLLPNGATASNAFGHLSFRDDTSWKMHSRISVSLSYEDLDGRRFKHRQELFVADNSGFASSYWGRFESPAGIARSSSA